MLSPIEIKKHEFSKAMRGYDPVEVRAFLESISNEFEKLLENLRSQSNEIERLRVELGTYQKMEQNMREAMVNAQETLRDAREGARRDAELIHREAEVIAERIINDARKKSEDIKREVESLIFRRDNLIRKLRALLRSELELINLLAEDDDVVKSEPTEERDISTKKSIKPAVAKVQSDSNLQTPVSKPN